MLKNTLKHFECVKEEELRKKRKVLLTRCLNTLRDAAYLKRTGYITNKHIFQMPIFPHKPYQMSSSR